MNEDKMKKSNSWFGKLIKKKKGIICLYIHEGPVGGLIENGFMCNEASI
jgi:hypothetical protein